MLSQAIAAPLRRRLARVDLASQPESVNEALVTARQGGYELICYPEILHWEDRGSAGETSPDKVTVKLTLIEVAIYGGKTKDPAHAQDLALIALWRHPG